LTDQGLIVKCPGCETRLRLSGQNLPSRFRARCTSCGKAFVVKQKDKHDVTLPLTSAPRADATTIPGQQTRSDLPLPDAVSGPRYAAATPPPTSHPGVTHAAAPAALGSTFSAGELVAERYRILRFVAQGGMGEVYEAEDQALGEVLALKTIRPSVAADEVAVGLFKREIQVARQVTHRNVCRIYDLGTHRSDSPIAALYLNQEILFVTMELLHGASMAQRLDGGGAMTPREALPLIEQMAYALDAAHAAGVVHRDFQSANVVLEAMDTGTRAVVTDFGLARGSQQTGGASGTLTVASAVMGSPAYMAPEQVEGGQITPAADIYALGVVIYEMTVGRVPFEGDSALSTAVKRLTEDPPPPTQLVEGFDPHWEEVILRCLERDPAKRFQRASDVVRALKGREEAAAVSGTTAVTTESAGKRMTKVVLAGVLLGLAIVANWYMWTKRAQEQAEFGYLQAPAVARPSVAVMEFRNLTGQEEVDWLASGLPEMLSSELAAGSGVRIIPGENVVRAKLELGLEEGDSFTDETLQILRRNLGTDYVVSGAYTAVADDGAGQLRLDLRLQDTLTTDQSAVVTVSGPASEIFDLVADAGSELRDALELETEAEAKRSFRMASAEAARLYSEGLARLRAYDALGASELLEQAAAADPRNPRVHTAYATALAGLGYAERAQEEAKLAMELSGPLGEEERLAIRGRYLETTGDWLGATEVYDQLWRASPDNLEYGLQLASTLNASGQPEQALQVTAVLKQLPSAAAQDVRIHFAEATASGAMGDFRSQQELAAAAAAVSLEQGARLLRARALLLEGWASRNLGEADRAQGVTAEAEGLYQQAGDLSGVAVARVQRANLLYDQGDLDTARRMFERAADTYRELGDKGNEAQALNNLAVVLKQQGEVDKALGLYEQSLELSQETGSRVGIANAENNIGAILLRRGDLSSAGERFQRAVELAAEVGDRSQRAYGLYNLAVTRRRQGRLDEAESYHQQALDLRRTMGQKLGEAASLADMASVAYHRGDIAVASERYAQALELAQSTGNRRFEAFSLFGLGQVRFQEGKLNEAQQLHSEALAIRRDLGERSTAAESRLALAQLQLERGLHADAETGSREAAAEFTREGAADLAAWAEANRAESLVYLDRRDEAARTLEGALARAEESEDLFIALDIELSAAKVEAASARDPFALQRVERVEDSAAKASLLPLALEAKLLRARLARAAGEFQLAEAIQREVLAEAESSGLELLAQKAREGS
jgi:tetratricopeptide (TPR) repeat protein